MDSAAILAGLLDTLWTRYKTRVVYATQYQKMVEARGGKVLNDHIAFRTFNCATGKQPPGVEAIARIFTALGYARKDKYLFEDKHLTAWHYEHAKNPDNPKLFISQLEVDELLPPTATLIKECVSNARDFLSANNRENLRALEKGEDLAREAGAGMIEDLALFFSRPWMPPKRSIIEPVNKESQYAAWTLLHGNAVNHFTAYINHQNVREWPDLEATVKALRAAGLPMKDELEGEKGSKLRQCSTKAADAECDVIEDSGSKGKMTWSYAYYELAERNKVPGPDGMPMLFQGFLGAQATNLFEMTKRG
jgi:hypothetical protein